MPPCSKTTSSVADPRLTLWFGHTKASTAASPEFKGIPNGLATTGLASYPDAERSYVWGLQTMPNWNTRDDNNSTFNVAKRQKVMDYSEVCFLKSEAALRGWAGAGNAETAYTDGIKASFAFEREGIDASLYSNANDNTYITTGSVAWSSESTLEGHLKQILTQKWLALYPNGVEAWTEFRRTGYPALTPVVVSLESTINAVNGEFVKKLRYTDDERRENPNATKATLNQNKGDGMNIRVWWDTNRYK
ncbi:MAG: SusD/RagB family nutrient-binding outer membrane lipoprotein [Prevotella conceptionensis]